MHDPANDGLRRIYLPSTWVNKGKRAGTTALAL
jgi:hypothetical protein